MDQVVRHIALGMPARFLYAAIASGEFALNKQGYTAAAVRRDWKGVRKQCEDAIK